MEDFEELLPKFKTYIIIILIVLGIILLFVGFFYYFNREINYLKDNLSLDSMEINKKEVKDEPKQYMVDIKGEVKTPGVYLLEQDKRVIDVVKKAGGFTNNADTSVNNLSMKIKDEMVIIIYSKKELADFLTTKKDKEEKIQKCNENIKNDSCITKDIINSGDNQKEELKNIKEENDIENKKTVSAKISINSASKEELTTLSGIGSAKADKIIEYRNTKKFETIEDIKKVSGIGDSLFEKIKDSITT